MMVEMMDGTYRDVRYVGHCRTLSYGGKSDDIDLFEILPTRGFTDSGTFEFISPSSDDRAVPIQVDPDAECYPGYPPGS